MTDGLKSKRVKGQNRKIICFGLWVENNDTFMIYNIEIMLWIEQVWCWCGGKILKCQYWTFSFKYKMRYLCGDVGLSWL